jgi:amidase
MSQTDLHYRSATALAAMLRTGEIGSRELLDHFWARVETHNPAINAIIWDDIEAARAAADAADAKRAAGEALGPLHGLPMTVKESYNLTASPNSWGIPDLKDHRCSDNADAVRRLIDAGAVIFGKTNIPIYLADWQSFNDNYGTTNNPWDLTRVPGGSSGGSAAALAAGLTGLEMGSDIGASIRNPAHYCGVYGHKPTFGVVSYSGHTLPGVVAPPDISVAGPLARSAQDLELAMNVVAGADVVDGGGWKLDLPPPRALRIEDFRIAVMLDDPVSEVDETVQDLIGNLAEFLGQKGATINYAARPDIDSRAAFDLYIGLLRAATSRRQTEAEFAANKAQVEAFADDDDSYYAKMLRAYVVGHRDWLGLNEKRHRLRLKWAAFFDDYDVLLCPAAASAAYPHDHDGERHERTVTVNGHEVPTTDQLFWAGYSCCFYLPGTVAPIGLTPEGLPVGVQIVAPQYGDLTGIELARIIERDYYAFESPPQFR